MFPPPLAPVLETQKDGEEGEYSDEGEGDRHREQRCLLSFSGKSRDYGKVSAPEVSKPPLVFPNRNDKSHDAAEDQRKPEVARRLGKIGGSDPGHLLQAIEELGDGEAESDQRDCSAYPRH